MYNDRRIGRNIYRKSYLMEEGGAFSTDGLRVSDETIRYLILERDREPYNFKLGASS